MKPLGVSPDISSACEIRSDDLTRLLYATDASIYRMMPAGVAFPRSAAQVGAAIRMAADRGMSVIPRGAGTGLVGGAIGDGLVVDFARHNRSIHAFDAEARTVSVGAGVVLDQLNAFLQPHGLMFGPDVATSSRATLGGMIANDSSGARVPAFGTTVDHLLAVELVLVDGTIVRAEETGCTSRVLASAVHEVIGRYRDPIAAQSGNASSRLLKRRPGYGLAKYLQHRSSIPTVIAGSEGTLAGIFSATLKVVPLPRRRGLGLVFFASVADAMQATVELLDLKPVAIEHIDRILFDQTRGQPAFAAARALLDLDAHPAEAILIVEFFDHVEERLAALAKRSLGLRSRLVTDPAEQALVWHLRKSGLALLTGRPGPAKPVTGIEDAAVRPEQLPEYVAALRGILDAIQVEASFYGHAAAGLLHVRPVLDLHTAEGVARLRHIADEVSALVRQFDGSLAGEHGVGIARTEYLALHLGPEAMAAHAELKRVFDPANVMNPGKIVPAAHASPFRIDGHLRQGAGHAIALPFSPMLGFVEKDGSFIGNLEQCNGVGVCLKRSPTMCPTYIATGDEIMSTRGRANAIRAVLERSTASADPLLSEELAAALDPCLSCKACKSECPSNVDMALLKAELLHARHGRAGVPLVDRLIAGADRLGRIGSATAPLANRLLRWRPLRAAMERTLGISAQRTLPTYAAQRFDTWFSTHPHQPRAGSRGRVLLWDDTWVRYHEPHIGQAAVQVLERAGFEVVLAAGRVCCGRPAFSRGLLGKAAECGRHNLNLLEQHYAGLPIVFLEPSCLAMFLDEYRQLRLPGAERVRERCLSFEQFVVKTGETAGERTVEIIDSTASLPDRRACADMTDGRSARSGTAHSQAPTPRVVVHPHCHARALSDISVLVDAARLRPGAEVTLLAGGCCGMAGAYGLMRKTYALSVAVAEPLIEEIRALPSEVLLVASGTSCRHQFADLAGRRAWHTAELLAGDFV